MTEQKRIIAALRAADISETDWHYYILEGITDLYARGYLSAVRAEVGNALSSDTEDYREELIKAAEWDIWGET